MEIMAALLVGIIIGGVCIYLLRNPKDVGTLYFYDMENPNEPPVMTSVLNEPVENIRKRSVVTFKVSHK